MNDVTIFVVGFAVLGIALASSIISLVADERPDEIDPNPHG